MILGLVALVTAIGGGIAGLGAYALYEAEVIGVDASASLIIASVLCSLIAVPIAVLGLKLDKRRGQEPVLAQFAILVSVGTLAAWFVVVVYALGK